MAAEPAASGSYRTDATRSGDWWAITLAERPARFGQCKRRAQAAAMAREVIA